MSAGLRVELGIRSCSARFPARQAKNFQRLVDEYRDALVMATCRKHRSKFLWAFFGVDGQYIVEVM
jgi:hypothetical protein